MAGSLFLALGQGVDVILLLFTSCVSRNSFVGNYWLGLKVGFLHVSNILVVLFICHFLVGLFSSFVRCIFLAAHSQIEDIACTIKALIGLFVDIPRLFVLTFLW